MGPNDGSLSRRPGGDQCAEPKRCIPRFDRLRGWTFPSHTPGLVNAADYEEYGYDPVGNRKTFRKRDGSTLAYDYDNLDRVIRKIVPERPGLTAAQTRDVHYDYDNALGLQIMARFDGLDGEGVPTGTTRSGR